MLIILLSLPQGILEAYAILLSIEKILKRSLTIKNIVTVYFIFLLAAILEVSFIHILLHI